MKRWAIFFLSVMMVLMASLPAIAAAGDATLFRAGAGGGSELRTAVAIGDTIFAAGWNDFFRYSIGSDEPTTFERQLPDGCEVRTFVRDGETIYAMCESYMGETTKMLLHTFSVSDDNIVTYGEPLELDWSQMMTDNGYGAYSREYESTFIRDGYLYLLAVNDDYQSAMPMAFSLTDGSCKAYSQCKDILTMVPYKDGKVLCQMRKPGDWEAPWRFGIVDLETGEATEAFQLGGGGQSVMGLAYDEGKDTMYFVFEGQLNAVTGLDKSTATPVNDLAGDMYSSIPMAGHLIGQDQYMLYAYQMLAIRSVDPSQRPNRTLRIRGYSEPGDAYHMFKKNNPDVSVSLGYPQSDDEIIQSMMARSEDTDLYLISTNSSVFQALNKRGYLAPIQSEVIQSRMAAFYPQIQEALTVEGQIAAVPESFYGDGFSYDINAMEKLGLAEEDMPKTWVELIEFLAAWDDRFGAEFPGMMPLPEWEMQGLRHQIFGGILNSYLTKLNKPGAQMTFTDPALREALSALENADFSDIEKEMNEEMYQVITMSSDGPTWLLSMNGSVGFQLYSNGNQIAMPLAFGDGQEALTGMTLYVYVINPFSKNQDIAVQYLESIIKNLPKATSMTFCPDENEPLRPAYYEQNRKEMQKYLDNMIEEQSKSNDEDNEWRTEMIAEQQRYLEQMEKNEWSASPEAIERYREIAKNIIVLTGTFSFSNSDVAREMADMSEKYMGGQVTTDQLLQNIEQKIRMMQMEGY